MDKACLCLRRIVYVTCALLLLTVFALAECPSTQKRDTEKDVRETFFQRQIKMYIDNVLSIDEYHIMPGVTIEKIKNNDKIDDGEDCSSVGRTRRSTQTYLEEKLDDYTKNHVLSVKLPHAARLFFSSSSPSSAPATTPDDAGKSSFLTGFGMGFLAFALKKLLLPVFIGAQLLKSVMIAMFLPSLLGGFGKIVGKGLSTFSGLSGASGGIHGNHAPANVEDFEFKDTTYNEDGLEDFMPAGTNENGALSINMASSTPPPISANSRYGFANHRIQYVGPQSALLNDNYYLRRPANKKTDYKVFHKIPSSSLLLTSYDPFYSPLLSRLDAVFQQLGLGNDKSNPKTEQCRERLVCLMYANPAKYAPYSNLVSAQLSRELNELRKPSSDNPEILRFFRYMKAAKDGQDGEECSSHGGCPALGEHKPSPAILTTFNDINKLVQARKLK